MTLYGTFSQYLTEFWRGFMLGVLIVVLPMSISNIYLARKEKGNKQKLDGFVVPKTLEEAPKIVEEVPPPPPILEEGEETGTPQATVAGLDGMLDVLRGFMNVWEQYARLSEQERLQSGYGVQSEAKFVASMLLSADARYADFWDQDLRKQVQVTSDTLHKFGISDRTDQTSRAKGKDAYDRASALLSLLKTRTTG